MPDVASLKIAINTGDVKTANSELDKLTATSAKTEKATTGVTSSFFSLGRVLSSVAILGTAQQFIKMADTMTGVESKLKLVTNNTLDLITAQQELFEISQKTRQGYAETVDTFSNFAVAMGDMGKSQKEVLRTVETINKAIAISGGTTQQAAAATMQLGQAFASGTLRGDELNSILENSKGLAQAIADGMGVPIGKLRTLGSEGKITAEILANALEKSAKSVDEKFSKVGVTTEASMTVLANSITNMIGKVDKQLGVTGSLGKLITDVSKHIDENTQDWVDSVQEAMDKMYPVAESGFTNIRDLSEVTFEGVNALFSVMVHAFDGAVDSMDDKYRELGFFDYMSLGFVVVIEGFRQIASGGLSALTFLGKQFNTFQAIALDAIAGVMGAMGKFQNAVGGDGSAFLEAQTFWANKANKVKQDGLLIDRTQKAILDDMGKGVDRLIGSYDKLALKKVKAKEVDTGEGGKGSGGKGNAGELTGGKSGKSGKDWYPDVPEMTKAFDVYEAMNEERNRKELEYINSEKEAQSEKWHSIMTEVKNFDDFYSSISDLQNSLELDKDILSGWNDFGANLDGIAGKIGNFAKTFSDMSKNNQKFIAKDLDLQKKYAKAFIDAKSDEEKEKFAMAEFDNAQAKNKEQQQSAEIAGYASIAGALGGLFEQGSAGAKAMAIVQGGLAIVSAGAGGDPYTVMPRMIAAAAFVHQALSASGISGGGVGGGGSSSPSFDTNFDLQREMIESNYTPMTDRLDRQIELLESIERNGSASQLGVELAGSEFMRDYKTWIEDTLEKARVGSVYGGASVAELERVASIVESVAGVDIYSVSGNAQGMSGEVELNLSALREGFNLINALTATLTTGGWGTFGQAGIEDFNSPTAWAQQTSSIRNSINDVQNLINEWALSVVDSMRDLTDAADDFRGYFDDITGSMYYETTRLKQAFDEVDRLRGDRSFSSYLQDTIENIDNLEKFFTDETFALLMSDSLDDIQAQIQAINELSAATGETFEGGAREALDYLESIELVAEAMSKSRENIRSFTESLMGDRISVVNMASSLGVASLATDTEQLADMFYRLSGDMDGLTDADLGLLDANLELIKNTDGLTEKQDAYNDELSKTSNSISVLNGALGSIQSTIDKLRGAAGGADYTMAMFYQSMNDAMGLKGSTNYEAFADAVNKAAGYSSALMDASNFEFSRDQRFAQAVAANQFAELEASTVTQIDYLKMIEENTRAQVEILSASINNLADTIDSELLKSIQERDPNTGYIASKYQEVLGRAADEAGIAYWANQIAGGAVSQSGLGIAIGAAGVANGELSRSKYVEMLYSKGLGRAGTPEEIDYWANQSSTPTTSLASMFAQLEPNFHSFDVGTANVPKDMLAQIHRGEIITPPTMSDDIRNGRLMMGDQSGIISAINSLGNRMASIEKVLNNSYDVQNGSLVELQAIGKVI